MVNMLEANKYLKGSVVDALFIVFIVFAILVVATIGMTIIKNMLNDKTFSKYTTQEIININQIILLSLDTLIAVIILGVIFLSISLVLYLRVPFGFVGLIVFVLPFLLFFANIISWFMKNMITYFDLIDNLKITYTMISNLPVLMLIFLFVLIILQYSPITGVFSSNE